MLTFILFILILSLLVLIHEFGHFYAARKNGIFVEEFGFGLPPRLIGKKIGETIYSLNLLPFGGFVKIKGEDDDNASPEDLEKAKKDPRNFISKKPWQKAVVLVAGVFMNVMLAVALYYVFFAITGFKSFALPLIYDDYNFRFGGVETIKTSVLSFSEESPAYDAGIRPGDAVLEIAGIPVYNIRDIRNVLSTRVGQETSILLVDIRSFDRELRTVHVTPIADEDGEGVVGFYIGNAAIIHYGGNKLFAGFAHAYNMLAFSLHTFSNLVSDAFTTRTLEPVSSSVAGPIGVFSVVGSILDYANSSQDPDERLLFSVLGLLDLTALLSLSLAFMNILPFPALDGGRLVFVAIEQITKKPISPRIESYFHRAGMLFLLGLLLLVTVKDVARLL